MNNLKIKEVVAKGIIVVVAAGNGGPYLGFVCKTAILINRTINHPADMDEVIAVGGIDDDQETPAWYSSRGMTTLELLYGAGRIKPDLMMLSKNIIAANLDGGCEIFSGTSFAVPAVTGTIALLLSAMKQKDFQNPNPI